MTGPALVPDLDAFEHDVEVMAAHVAGRAEERPAREPKSPGSTRLRRFRRRLPTHPHLLFRS